MSLPERQRSPSAHFVRRSGGTPCWNFLFGCSCPGPVRNRGRVVDALSIDVSGGSVGRAVGHYSDSNVSVHRTAHLVRRTVERIVRCYLFISFCAFLGRSITFALMLDIRKKALATSFAASSVLLGSAPTALIWIIPFSGNPSVVISTPARAFAFMIDLICSSAMGTFAPPIVWSLMFAW